MIKKYDLIILGGGLTGVAAAIAAARENINVLIIEKHGFLGGAATNSQVNPFMNYTLIKNGEQELVNSGIFKTILKRLDDLGGLHENKVTFNEEILKLLLDRMVDENGIDVLFHSYLLGTKRKEDKIQSIIITNKLGKQHFSAEYFIDCTGDADLAAYAGCPYQLGRDNDNLCQPMTLCFRLGNVKAELSLDLRNRINSLYKIFQSQGKIKNPRENVLIFPHMSDGVWHFNSTRIIKKNPIDPYDLSYAEKQSREQVYELYSFLKNNIEGFEYSTLLMSAPQIGIRESRLIEGEYKITEKDILSCKKFYDSIARGNYSIDIHNPDGTGTRIQHIPEGEYYTIPYRALIPINIGNLLVAGRCISSSHEAQSAYRIMPICCCIGEGAGTAISLALKDKIPTNKISVEKLQQLLEKYEALY